MSWMVLGTSFGGCSCERGLETRTVPFKSFVLVQGGMFMRYIVGFGPLGWRIIDNTAKNRLQAAKQDFGIFGEVEGAISGLFGRKTSTDPHHCDYFVPNQYTGGLFVVWATAWSTTMPTTARGGQRRAIFGILSGPIGFNSRLLGKIHCALSFLYLTIYQEGVVSAWAEVWTLAWLSIPASLGPGGR